jgi:HlyD family secretion protein
MKRSLLAPILVLFTAGIISCGNDNGVPAGSGFIEATSVVMSAETGGRLEALYFDEGDMVKEGDIIALIDTTTVSLRLTQARAGLAAALTRESAARLQIEKAELDSSLARIDFDRTSELIGTGGISQQQYDRVENKYLEARLAHKAAGAQLASAEADKKRAAAEIAILKKQKRDCRPRAPLSGSIVTSYTEAGELLAAGKPIVKIAKLDPVTVKIYLPPAMLTRVKLGARAEVDPEDGMSSPLTGEVTWISPQAEFTPKNVESRDARADLVYAVEITIPNPDQTLKIGMPVMVRIP